MKKNVAGQSVGAELVSSSDGTAFTGSVTVYVTGDRGTQTIGSVGSGACTHEGNGFHTYAPDQAETNYDHVAFTFTGTGAVPVTVQIYTRPTTGLLAPTVADRTLDVSAGGEAGIDLANVGSPTTTLNLSGTTISTSQAVASVTGSVNSVTGNVGGSVGSVIGNVGGTVATVTTLSNMPAIPNNWLTAAGVASGALNGKGDWNIGKTGYSLSAGGVQAIWDALTSALTTVGSIGKLLVDNVNATISSRSTYAGADTAGTTTLLGRIVGTLASGTHSPQSGDAFARLGAPAGASIAEDIQTRLAASGYTAPPSASTIASAVWNLTVSGHTTSGTFGAAMNAAGSAGDPWSTPLPGAYASGTAGNIVGNNLNATVSSRLATASYTVPPTTSEIVTAMGTGTFLTAIPWNASWDAEVQSECADALAAYDPPTNAEMEARTIVAASYATATELAKVIKSGEEFTATDGIGSKDVTHTRI